MRPVPHRAAHPMKGTIPAAFAALALTAVPALADHGADPARELPLWLLLAVPVVVGLAYALVSALRKRSQREPRK